MSALGDACAGIQALDRATAEVLKYYADVHSSIHFAANRFLHKCRLVACDHYAANLKAERHIAAERANWMSLVVGCESHSSVGVHIKVTDLVPHCIRGSIALALSVTMAGMMSKFRASPKGRD